MAGLIDDKARGRLIGSTGAARLVVTDEDSAVAFNSGGVPVLATPRMIALMEQAACEAVSGLLPEGVTTVGVHLDVTHIHPSPIGAVVTAAAMVADVQRNRITFEVNATHELGRGAVPIGSGQHLRVAVVEQDFVAALDAQR
jgi:fluoroacetyl-CoA thioesterase